MASSLSKVHERILATIRRIPRGRVMTYGEVALVSGIGRGARVVATVLRLAKGTVPWHRVVGKRRAGRAHISIKDPVGAAIQRQMLEKEGVKFGKDETIDLDRYGAY